MNLCRQIVTLGNLEILASFFEGLPQVGNFGGVRGCLGRGLGNVKILGNGVGWKFDSVYQVIFALCNSRWFCQLKEHFVRLRN